MAAEVKPTQGFNLSEGMAGRAARLMLAMDLAELVDNEALIRGMGRVTVHDPNNTEFTIRMSNGVLLVIHREDANGTAR